MFEKKQYYVRIDVSIDNQEPIVFNIGQWMLGLLACRFEHHYREEIDFPEMVKLAQNLY